MTIYDNLETLTTGAFAIFQQYANASLDAAYQAVASQQNFAFQPIPLSVAFDAITVNGGSFIEPEKPVIAIDPFEVPDVPSEPTIAAPVLDSFGTAPSDPGITTVYSPPGGTPDPFTAQRPGNAPTFDAME